MLASPFCDRHVECQDGAAYGQGKELRRAVTRYHQHDAFAASLGLPVIRCAATRSTEDVNLEVLLHRSGPITGAMQKLVGHVLLLRRPAKVTRVYTPFPALAARMGSDETRSRLRAVRNLAHHTVSASDRPVGRQLPVAVSVPRKWPNEAVIPLPTGVSLDPFAAPTIVVASPSGRAWFRTRLARSLRATVSHNVISAAPIDNGSIAAAALGAYGGSSHFRPLTRLMWLGLERRCNRLLARLLFVLQPVFSIKDMLGKST
jgi:hypothetical protein